MYISNMMENDQTIRYKNRRQQGCIKSAYAVSFRGGHQLVAVTRVYARPDGIRKVVEEGQHSRFGQKVRRPLLDKDDTDICQNGITRCDIGTRLSDLILDQLWSNMKFLKRGCILITEYGRVIEMQVALLTVRLRLPLQARSTTVRSMYQKSLL